MRLITHPPSWEPLLAGSMALRNPSIGKQEDVLVLFTWKQPPRDTESVGNIGTGEEEDASV